MRKNVLSWRNVDIALPYEYRHLSLCMDKIIANACGSIESGVLVILGRSVAESTTLLNVFAGQVPSDSRTTGEILINGFERDEDWPKKIGYFDLHYVLFFNLTLRETIENSSKMRNQNDLDNLTELIENLAVKLGISDLLDRKLESLSNYECRVGILAIELIHDPEFLFLDSFLLWLSRSEALQMAKLLRSISQEGKVIVLTIRDLNDQILDIFHKLVLLSYGRTVYMGDAKRCQSYFESKSYIQDPKKSVDLFIKELLSTDPFAFGSQNDKIIREMVADAKEEHGFVESEKIQQTNNLRYEYTQFNMKGVGRLLMRRLKFFTFANRLKNFLLQIILCSCALVILSFFYKGFSYELSNIADKLARLLDLNYFYLPTELGSKKFRLEGYFFCMIQFFPPVFTVAASYCSCAFLNDFDVVRREIGLGCTSVISYYFAILLYQYIMGIFPIIILASVLIFIPIVRDSFSLDFLNLGLLFLFSVPFYIFIASIFKSNFFAVIFSFLTVILNTAPINLIINEYKLRSDLKEDSIWPIFLNFLPSYSLTAINLNFYIDKMQKTLTEIAEKSCKNASSLKKTKEILISQVDTLRKIFTSTALYKINFIYLLYLFLGCFAVLYVCLTLNFMRPRLKPQIRLRLNG